MMTCFDVVFWLRFTNEIDYFVSNRLLTFPRENSVKFKDPSSALHTTSCFIRDVIKVYRHTIWKTIAFLGLVHAPSELTLKLRRAADYVYVVVSCRRICKFRKNSFIIRVYVIYTWCQNSLSEVILIRASEERPF